MTSTARAFQIFYDEPSRALLDPVFEPLDNTNAARPDWYEYASIREYLRRHDLEPATHYGFLSPTFRVKTSLDGTEVLAFLEQSAAADVVTFSPFPCHAAFFVNVFEQGNLFHPGLLDTAARLFPGEDLNTLVTDSRTTVYCNFLFAKAPFWKRWSDVFDRVADAAETPSSPLREDLNRTFEYTKDNGVTKLAQMKVFLMERAVSLLLSTSSFTVRNYPPFRMPLTPDFAGRLPELVQLDALKIAFRETRDPHFLEAFLNLRNRIVPRGE